MVSRKKQRKKRIDTKKKHTGGAPETPILPNKSKSDDSNSSIQSLNLSNISSLKSSPKLNTNSSEDSSKKSTIDFDKSDSTKPSLIESLGNDLSKI